MHALQAPLVQTCFFISVSNWTVIWFIIRPCGTLGGVLDIAGGPLPPPTPSGTAPKSGSNARQRCADLPWGWEGGGEGSQRKEGRGEVTDRTKGDSPSVCRDLPGALEGLTRDRFRKVWQKKWTVLGLNKRRGRFLNFPEASLILLKIQKFLALNAKSTLIA
jgi:hypothetical protein